MDPARLGCRSILKRYSPEDEDVVTAAAAAIEVPEDAGAAAAVRRAQCSLKRFDPPHRQGILKKKHSASFDEDSTQKPILKNRCRSCDDRTMLGFSELHSILKRKTCEPPPHDAGPPRHQGPHGILKKRDESAAATTDDRRSRASTAADRGVRPILKQSAEPRDRPAAAAADDGRGGDYRRPILKKVHAAAAINRCGPDDTKPILKSPAAAGSDGGPLRGGLSVAQRVSNLESAITVLQQHEDDEKPAAVGGGRPRGARAGDRSRFRTQPVTPSEINAVKRTTATRSENYGNNGNNNNNSSSNNNRSAAAAPSETMPPPPNRSTTENSAATDDAIGQTDNRGGAAVRASMRRAAAGYNNNNNNVAAGTAKTREFRGVFRKTAEENVENITPDVNSNIAAKSRPSKYKQCQEKKLNVANRYSTQPVTDHELQVAKNLNSAKCKNDDNNTQPVNNLHELDDGKNLNSVKCKNYDDNNGRPPRKKLGSFVLDRLRIFTGIASKNHNNHIEKAVIDLNNVVMEENTTECPKNQSDDKNTNCPKSNVRHKDEKKKIPEIIVDEPVKSLKEPNDIERIKSRISRNVAINRSFNSNSKLELLRQHKFGDKSKENEKFSKPKKHVEPFNDDTDGTSVFNGGSIKDRLVALKKSGQTDWQKRILKIKPEDHEVSNSSINTTQDSLRKQLTRQIKSTEDPMECVDNVLVDRLNQLETSSKDWKKRVEQKDSTNFTVAGKMQNKSLPPLTPALKSVTLRSSLDKSSTSSIKKKLGEESTKQTNIRRSHSMSDSKTKSYLNNKSEKVPLENGSNSADGEKTVNVPVMTDDSFDKFFGSAVQTPAKDTQISDVDFDHLKSTESNLLVQRKKVKAQQRKHEGSKNPLKALATNRDLAQQQYIENKSNLLLRRSLDTSTINTPLAREALAALASKEDFASVNLRKSADLTPTLLPPFKDLMLLHLKGRRRVQTRLVSPTADSVNQGDCYVLVTPSQIFVWIGEYSNVIERSHAVKVAQSILDKKDLGSKLANHLFTINCNASLPNGQHEMKFWSLLGVASNDTSTFKGVGAGHPDEDELYETAIVSTNVVYEVVDGELVVLPDISGTMPKIEILNPSKTLVFDFGSEVYVWYGKNGNIAKRKPAIRLARQLFDDGYDFSQYDVSPIDVASCLGNRNKDAIYVKRDAKRPEWTLFAKITQHTETVLFREKFADWPDYSRVIRLQPKKKEKNGGDHPDKCIDWSADIRALDVDEMLNMSVQEPDLVLEGSHLGRGSSYYDKNTLREFAVNTISVTVWHVREFDSTELDSKSIGQLHSGDSYIIRWTYNVYIQGRELSGLPSRRMVTSGRNRCAYWYWHGRKATQNDQGAAALLTVQLDTEQGPQLRVDQGHEPPAFWNLFKGMAIVYRGKRNETPDVWRLFMVHGANEAEAHLTEVACSTTQLRSQTSFVLLNSVNGTVFVWHGSGSSDAIKELSISVTNRLKKVDHKELGLAEGVALQELKIINETKEPSEFFQALGCMNSRRLYVSHHPSRSDGNGMKLFHFSSVLGKFKASLVSSAYIPSPYPYLQDHLYNVSQPATFMLDTGEELWLWQGWWPETVTEDDDNEMDEEDNNDEQPTTVVDHRGSLSTRLHAERRAAMQTALDYWSRKYGDSTEQKAYLVWAGLEPLRFTDCFPEWHDRDDIAEINMKHNHKPGETLTVKTELARVTQKSYPPAQLLQRPLPDGVDPTRLELYLSPDSFKGLLDMNKTEFLKLPKWKRTKIKQSVGLF